MHRLLTDETNKEPSKDVRFFVYGGLFFPIEHLSILHNEIEQIRAHAGYKHGDIHKFDTNARPSHIDFETTTKVKREIIDLCLNLECKFIAHVILHDIIHKQDFSEQMQKAADYRLADSINILMKMTKRVFVLSTTCLIIRNLVTSQLSLQRV